MAMSRKKKRIEDLIEEIKEDLLKDPEELEKIEERLDRKHMDRLLS